MKFHRYNSIENTYNKKLIENALLLYPDRKYIVTEKIHGANFSVWITKDEIRYAKRSCFLSEGEGFYNWQKIREKYEPDFKQLIKEIPSANLVVIYGELFGGNYPGEKVHTKAVQKGVYYSPDIEFMAFDMLVNEKIVNFKDFSYCMDNMNIPRSTVLFEGNLKECLEFPEEFETTIPERLGLPKIENNFAEGVVISPEIPSFFGNHQRIIFKKKAEKWQEKAKARKVPRVQKEVPPEAKKLFEELSKLLNPNRVASAFSKLGEPDMKLIGPAIKEVNLDIINECENEDWYVRAEKIHLKKATSLLNQSVANEVKKFIVEN